MRKVKYSSVEAERAERLFLNYSDKSGMHTVEISAEGDDSIEVFKQSNITHVLIWNEKWLYAGIESFVGSVKLGDCFYHNQKDLEKTLGKKGLQQSPVTMVKKLVQYVQRLPSAGELLAERLHHRKGRKGRPKSKRQPSYNIQIQAAVSFPVTVDMEVDIRDLQTGREEILDQAGHILETSMIKPSIENVVALGQDGKTYVDITTLFDEKSAAQGARSARKPRYRIACWIPIEADEPEIYENHQKALRDLEHCQTLQPENIYQIEVVDEDDRDQKTQ